MTVRQFAQDNIGNEEKLSSRGSIYDRLDKARLQRAKSLAPQIAANSAPTPIGTAERANRASKSQLLPTIKRQEDFDPPLKSGLPGIAKLGLGILAFSIMAGFSLLDWGAGGLQTNVAPLSQTTPEIEQTKLPKADDPARVTDAQKVNAVGSDDLPVIPVAPSNTLVIEAQQDTQSLNTPAATQNDAGQRP